MMEYLRLLLWWMVVGVKDLTNTPIMPSLVLGVIFGAATKYCSVCAISEQKNSPPPSHQCYRNWSGTSCAMEANIIAEGFQLSEQLHGVQYLWFIGDGDSSVYHAVVTGVPSYGRCVQKVECANHAIKCYRNRLEALCKNHQGYM